MGGGQNTTADPRCDLFNNLNGISNVTITDHTSYPWQLLNLKADGMDHLGFTIPEGSTGLMSGNYHKGNSTSYTEVNFKVEKPLLLTFKFLVSSDYYDKATITLDDKEYSKISDIKQIEIKELLSAGSHTLKLSYSKDDTGNYKADRAFIYDLKTATTFSEYVAAYDATNTTLTFKKITSDNLEGIDLNLIPIVKDGLRVDNLCAKYLEITNIVFEESFKTYAPTSLKGFFSDCIKLQTISGLEYLNTADVTNMRNMFNSCYHLKSLNLTNFNTEKVKDMRYMFYDCYRLPPLDLTNFNTVNVEDMKGMFKDCYDLTSLDLTSFNTESVKDMNSMFYNCKALTTIYASDKFVTTKVTDGSDMFCNCEKLIGVIEYKKNTDKKDHNYANYSTGYFTPGCGYAEFDNATGTLTFRYKGVKPEGAYDLNVSALRPQWKNIETTVKKVVFDASFASARPTICYAWFYNNTNLTTIEGIEYLNTEDVTDMGYMFAGCSALESLDLSKFNTAKVTSMVKMFYNCSALKSLNLSGFNTAKATDMNRLFAGCSALESLDLSMFNTSSVESMPNMFDGAKNLKTLNVSSFNTEKTKNMGHMFTDCSNLTTIEGIEYLNTEDVTDMGYMFAGCSALESLDLSKFNTAKVTSMVKMFYNCSALKSLNLSGFNTAKATDMNRLFAGCSALESLDLSMFNTSSVESMPNMFEGAKNLKTLNVSSFNTEKTKNMGHMFTNCSNLTSLDLSSFNTKGVEYVDYMFQNCSNLTTIYVSANFAFGSGLKNGSKMFLDCKKLKGFKGYIPNYTSNKLAKYTTGYLTKLVGKNGDEKIGAVGKTLTAESLALADDKDFVAYEPFIATKATYNRDMKEDTTWATLCMPFEVSLDGQNFRAFKLLSADEGTNTIKLEEIKTNIEAGTPVIIKMKEGQNTLDFSVTGMEITKDVKTATATEGNYQLQGIYSKKMFSKDTDNNCYIVKGDKLMNPAKLLENTSTTQVASKPFRAYMVDNTSAPAPGAKMFSIGFDDNTTAIDSLNTIADDNAIYYDLQGKRLNAPQKGINIVKRGGKTMKVIIK